LERSGVAPISLPFAPKILESGDRLFAQEASPAGCASGECLPEVATTPIPPAQAAVEKDPPVEVPRVAPTAPSVETVVAEPPVKAGYSSERWRIAVDSVRKASPRHGMSLAHGRVVDFQDGQITLGFAKEAAFHRATVSGNGKPLIEKTLTHIFGQPIRLTFTESVEAAGTSEPASLSLAEQETQARVSRERSAEQRLRAHPAVRAALQILGGQIEHIQVLDKEGSLPSETDASEDGA
jgi:hypothetical protein